MNMIIIERSKMHGSNISVSLSLRDSVEKDYDAFRFRIDGEIGEWITFDADKESMSDSTIAINFQCPASILSHKIEAECLKDGEWIAAPYIVASSNISPNLTAALDNSKKDTFYPSGCPSSAISSSFKPIDYSTTEYRNPKGGALLHKRDGTLSVISPLVQITQRKDVDR